MAAQRACRRRISLDMSALDKFIQLDDWFRGPLGKNVFLKKTGVVQGSEHDILYMSFI